MRRGAGLSGLQRHTSTAAQYTTLSSTLTTQQLSSLRAQLDAFRTHLVAFATAHRTDIRADPKLRHEFQKMCAAIGIDPLAIGAAPPTSAAGGGKWLSAAKGIVGDILGMSDWQHELAVQIVDVCASTRDLNGGMIAMHDLIARVQSLRTVTQDAAAVTITPEDVIRSVKLLKPLNAGYEIHTIPPSREPYIRSVPSELDTDTITLLGLASSAHGHLGEPVVIRATGWTDTRTRAAFEKMVVRDGVAWVDEQVAVQGGGMEIWIPSACKWK